MKAISLWQPWASAMASGVKQIETRSWPTKVRGDVVVCASKHKLSTEEMNAIGDEASMLLAQTLPYGCALCVVELYDCWPTDRINNLRQAISEAERDLGNYETGRFAWLTRNCRALKTPVPITGRQGFWNLTLRDVIQVQTQL